MKLSTLWAMAPLTYRIDAEDRVIEVSPNWPDQPRETGEIVPPEQVLGRNLWSQIADLGTSEIYRQMVRSARSGRSVRFHYRCDTPTEMRVFEMTLEPLPRGEVKFSTVLRNSYLRPAAPLLVGTRPRDESFIRMCSWCQDVALPTGQWVDLEQAVEQMRLLEAERLPRITHGICDECSERMRRMMKLP